MKKLLLLLVTLITLTAFGQDKEDPKYGKGSVPFVDGKVIFTEVVQVDGKSADELYSLAKLAIAEMFKSANDVIQLDDKEGKTIIVKGMNKNTESPGEGTDYLFMMRIFLKDGRYKVDLTDFVYISPKALVGKMVVPETRHPAENLTDENCLNRKGETKWGGYGLQRRFLINTKEYILTAFKTKMTTSTKQDDNW